MALIIKDRVKEITTTTGTGAVSLGGSSATFDAFQSVMSNGDTTFYAIVHTASGTDEWEVGLGTWNTGNTLTRTTIYAGSNGTSAVNFSSGNKDIFMTYPASKAAVAGEDVTFADVTATDITATGTVTLSGDPTSALQAATKEYVDTIAAAGIHYHTPVRVESPSALTATYDNGTSGVGATLTNSGTQAALVIDGVTLSTSDRVLVYNQTNAAHNGIYTVTNTGSASTNWVLTRATDADSYGASDPDALGEGDAYFVKEGDTGAGELYVMNTSGVITFGTTAITFTVIAETAVYSAGTGLTLTGTTFSTNQDISTSASPTFNNITVTGTVDGRDVATDGSKLDGIEAGATADQTAAEIKTAYESNSNTNAFTDAEQTKLSGIETGATGDQTASEILTAIKTVDGVGSNLDADLLDGQQGSYYLNTGTTFSGDVSGTYNAIVVANDSHTHSNYLLNNANDTTSGILTVTDGVITEFIDVATQGNRTIQGLATRNTIGSSGGYGDLHLNHYGGNVHTVHGGGTLYANGNAVFHDGYHPNADKWTTARTLTLSGDASGSVSWDGSANATLSVTVANDSHSHSHYITSNANDSFSGLVTSTNTTVGMSFNGALSWAVSSSDAAHQRADARDDATNYSRLHWYGVSDGGSTNYFRHAWYDGSAYINIDANASNINFTRTTGTANLQVHGNTVWHAGNDGSGSGLDADNLDGRTWSSTRNAANTLVTRDGNGYTQLGWINTTSGATTNINKIYASADDYIRYVTPATFRSQVTDGFYLGATAKAADSNLLDGIDSSSFLRSDANDTSSGTIAFGTGTLDPDSYTGYSGGFGHIADGGGWSARGLFINSGTGQAAAMAVGSGNVYFGTQNGSSANSMNTWLRVTQSSRVADFSITPTVSGSTVWHAGNDGSGSGLDADRVDGVHGTSFLRNDTNSTFSEILTLSKDAPNILNFSANTTSNSRGISFNNKVALSANGTDAFLRLNSSGLFTSGVYTPGNLTVDNNIYLANTLYHYGDTNTYLSFGTDTITLATGGSSEITINTTGVRLGDTGNAYVQPVSGNYGSFQIDGGAHTGWEGYSIGGRAVFMHNNSTTTGLYNDVDNEWLVNCTHNGPVYLYHNGTWKLQTSSTGVTVSGTVAATSYTGDGSQLTGISASATNDIFWENGQTVSSNYTITNNKNAMSAGPITINSGVLVTIGDGETWTIV